MRNELKGTVSVISSDPWLDKDLKSIKYELNIDIHVFVFENSIFSFEVTIINCSILASETSEESS